MHFSSCGTADNFQFFSDTGISKPKACGNEFEQIGTSDRIADHVRTVPTGLVKVIRFTANAPVSSEVEHLSDCELYKCPWRFGRSKLLLIIMISLYCFTDVAMTKLFSAVGENVIAALLISRDMTNAIVIYVSFVT